MAARVRWQGRRRRVQARTAARGYGGPHQKIRAAYVAAFRPGQPCAIGGEPLDHHTHRAWCDLLDLAHDHLRGGYLGLACHACNRGEPSRRRLGLVTVTASTGRRW